MKANSPHNAPRPAKWWPLLALAALLPLAGCAGIAAPEMISKDLYVLEAQPVVKAAPARRDLVLAVSTLRARPGFETAQIAYVQKPHELNYFVANRWVAAPARMLEPLLLDTLARTGGFRSVVPTAGAVPADLVLDVELARLQHDFATRPSQVQLTLQARLIDLRGKRVLATWQFSEAENAPSEDAYGGVIAANRLVARALEQLAGFCLSESPAR